jgi:hypothetical protein
VRINEGSCGLIFPKLPVNGHVILRERIELRKGVTGPKVILASTTIEISFYVVLAVAIWTGCIVAVVKEIYG